jgi:threonine dehydrogenase-like Zn-dependent dehydrogenase
MKQAELVGPKAFRLKDVPNPKLGASDVLVKVRACGVCASELHAWEDGEGAPRMLGHEVAGEIVGLGDKVSGFGIGDRVTGLFHEGFADHAVTSFDRVVPIPKDMDFDHAFGEPLACAMSGALRTKVELGDRVILIGLGFMGLLMLQLIRLKGPAHIIGVDIRDDALAAGKRFGCDAVMKPGEVEHLKATFADKESLAKGGVEVVIEATGTQKGLTLAGELVKQHGVLSILGYHQGKSREVDMQLWNFKAFEMLNAHERRSDYRLECMRRGLALAAAGRIDLASLVTHTYPLDQVDAAFGALAAKPAGFIKSVVLSAG